MSDKDIIKVQKDGDNYYIMVNGRPKLGAFFRGAGTWFKTSGTFYHIVTDEKILEALKIQERKEKLAKLLDK